MSRKASFPLHAPAQAERCPTKLRVYDDRNCPARVVLDHLADKWTVLIIGRLANGTLRFAELRRSIDGISQKMLTATLRDLERDGLVRRRLYASVPPKVEYSLTPLGSSLVTKVEELCRWAETNIDQVIKAREEFDQRVKTEKLADLRIVA